MGLENMRGGYGRCPPLLVGGLLVVCLILTCNWWSLSTQNLELLKQVEDLGQQLRACAEERDQSQQLRLSVDGRLKSTEEELAQARVRLEQQDINADEAKKQLDERDATAKRLTKEVDTAKNSLTMCTTELESLKKVDQSKDDMIAALKLEKQSLVTAREERKKEAEKLQAELTKAQMDLHNLQANQPVAPNKVPAATWWRPPSAPKAPKLTLELHDRGMHGIHYHAQPVLPRDPPNAFRPPPRFSVTQLTTGKPAQAKPDELNVDERERDEDNAKERDDGNVGDVEDERFDKNNDENENNNIPEDSVDQMAHAIQEEDGQAPAPKAATP